VSDRADFSEGVSLHEPRLRNRIFPYHPLCGSNRISVATAFHKGIGFLASLACVVVDSLRECRRYYWIIGLTLSRIASGTSMTTRSPGCAFSAVMFPWWISTARRAIASPKPTLPVAVSGEVSARKKASKI
jgi:hypothetical protein